MQGIPDKLVIDNRPSLCSMEMEEFLRKSSVFHIKISPNNPSSNGVAKM